VSRNEIQRFFWDFIKEYCLLNRTAVSEDTDELIQGIQNELDCNTLEIPSGSECLTWTIPKFWKVHEAYLAQMDGRRVIDFRNNPLHLWTHSITFQGELDHSVLDDHLYYDIEHPDCIPYHYRNGYRFDAEEWGFCLSYNDYLQLNDDKYYVFIDTELATRETMKVIDDLVCGNNPATIYFAAHTCHPGIATDGLSNIAVLIALFKYLKGLESRKYSYRLILGPEYFAAAGFLDSTPENEIINLKGGIYLDMLGNNQPFCYQSSFQGDSVLDNIVRNVFDHHVPDHRATGFRGVWGNDEMFYNGTGFMIPSLGIVCDRHPEYHLHTDNLNLVNLNQLEFALELIKKIVSALEDDYTPIPRFKGPIYLSRYDLYIDPKEDRKGYANIQNIQFLMDGKRSCFEISHELDVDFFFVKSFCDSLLQTGLIERQLDDLFPK